MIHHKPVMVDEVVSAIQPRSGGRYIDCTTGEGGHAEAILGHCDPPARLLGLDLDREALAVAEDRLARFGETTKLVETSYVNIAEVAAKQGFVPCDGVLFDLGVSSLQLENASRGFAFLKEASLDMRFGPSIGRSAREIVNETDETDLANLIYRLGEERRSRRIARAIVRARPVETTVELAEVVVKSDRMAEPGSQADPPRDPHVSSPPNRRERRARQRGGGNPGGDRSLETGRSGGGYQLSLPGRQVGQEPSTGGVETGRRESLPCPATHNKEGH